MSIQVVELNPVGNFEPWETSKLNELEKNQASSKLGQCLLYENDTMRLLVIRLKPKERLPFHRRSQFYSWTCNTDGLAVSRHKNGSIILIKFKKGATHFWDLGENGTIADFENTGEELIVIHVIEFIKQFDKAIKNILKLDL